jgi:hypothetical protein
MSDRQKKINEVLARVWKDEDYKQKLLSDPRGTLNAAGLTFPDKVRLKVHLDTADTLNIVIPRNPSDVELSDSTLDAVSGGSGGGDTCANTTCQEHCW